MERKKSSGQPFKMRSPKTPYPFLGAIGRGIKKLAQASPIGQAVGALKGGSGGGSADDVNTKIDEIHEALVGGGEMGGGTGESSGLIGRTLATAAKDAVLTKNKKY